MKNRFRRLQTMALGAMAGAIVSSLFTMVWTGAATILLAWPRYTQEAYVIALVFVLVAVVSGAIAGGTAALVRSCGVPAAPSCLVGALSPFILLWLRLDRMEFMEILAFSIPIYGLPLLLSASVGAGQEPALRQA
jgi:hypothetical protein